MIVKLQNCYCGIIIKNAVYFVAKIAFYIDSVGI
jgi:hypothetical protein